jgi:hypothetical protein
MDKPEVALRRKKLMQWVRVNGTPPAEKSLFSQLKGTGSFGEKVARRLEEDYKMGHKYLDTEDAVPPSNKPVTGGVLSRALSRLVETPDELELLAVYRLSRDDERKAIDRLVSVIRSRLDTGAIGNEPQ